MVVNEVSALQPNASGKIPSYNAAVGKEVDNKRSLSNSSISSERRYSTAHLFGIMIPKDFFSTLLWAVLSILTSISGVAANNSLFKGYKFPLLAAQPMQMLGQIIISVILGFCCHDGKTDPKTVFWPRFRLNWRIALSVSPMAFLYIPRILSTNGALGQAAVMTYQVVRQTAIVFSVLFSALILGIYPSFLAAFACLIIVGGFVVAAFDKVALSLLAVEWGLFAGVSSALYLVVVKYFLPAVDQDSRVLINYNATISFIILIPLMFFTGAFTEALSYLPWTPAIPALSEGVPLSYLRIWLTILVSILTSFFINIASTMLVKVSSPVTYDVVGALKTILLALYGVLWNNERLTWTSLAGIFLSIVGSLVYGKAKHMEHVNKVKSDAAEKKRMSMEKRMGNTASPS